MNQAKWEQLKKDLEDADGPATEGIVKNVVSDIETMGTPEQKARIVAIRERVGEIDEDPENPRSWRSNLLGEINNPRSPMWVDRQMIPGDVGGRRRRRTTRRRKTSRKTRKHIRR